MVRLCVVLAGISVIASLIIAIISREPHWMQRGGALLAAISALIAIVEASLERKIHVREIEAEHEDAKDLVRVPVLRRLEAHIKSARFRADADTLSSEKVKAIFIIGLIAIFGEILHGFGDLLISPVI